MNPTLADLIEADADIFERIAAVSYEIQFLAQAPGRTTVERFSSVHAGAVADAGRNLTALISRLDALAGFQRNYR